jgi:hypothetical protein
MRRSRTRRTADGGRRSRGPSHEDYSAAAVQYLLRDVIENHPHNTQNFARISGLSLNRLNVATSRARCACVLVANPRLFEPECRSPRQMRLANGLCEYGASSCSTAT